LSHSTKSVALRALGVELAAGAAKDSRPEAGNDKRRGRNDKRRGRNDKRRGRNDKGGRNDKTGRRTLLWLADYYYVEVAGAVDAFYAR
jgi:hypothetical protein